MTRLNATGSCRALSCSSKRARALDSRYRVFEPTSQSFVKGHHAGVAKHFLGLSIVHGLEINSKEFGSIATRENRKMHAASRLSYLRRATRAATTFNTTHDAVFCVVASIFCDEISRMISRLVLVGSPALQIFFLSEKIDMHKHKHATRDHNR